MNFQLKVKKRRLLLGGGLIAIILVLFSYLTVRHNRGQAEMTAAYANSAVYQRESIIDRARFVTQRDGRANIVVLGSSVTYGLGSTETQPVWGELLQDHLNSINEIEVNVNNFGYSGYSTADLIRNNKIEPVIAAQPDIIFFELCLINNNRYPQNTIIQTQSDIQYILETFANELPQTMVILTTANPTIYNDVILADGEITYHQYNEIIAQYVREQNWPLIDIYQLMSERLEQAHVPVEDILVDHVHPNGDGYQMWFEILQERLTLPVSGL